MAEISGASGGASQDRIGRWEVQLGHVQGRLLGVVGELEKVDGALAALGKKSSLWKLVARLKRIRLLRERELLLKERGSLTESEKALLMGLGQGQTGSMADSMKILTNINARLIEVSESSSRQNKMIQELSESSSRQNEISSRQNEMIQELSESSSRQNEMIQLVLRGQFEPMKTFSTLSKNVKDTACSAYGVDSSCPTVRCFVTGVEITWQKMKTAHIYQRRWPGAILQRIGIDIHSASNLVLMWDLVEVAFDKYHLTIIPEGGVFIVHVLYPKIRSLMIESHASRLSNITWNDIDGRELQFPNSFRPAKRLFAIHATMAITHAVENGWMTKEAVPNVPEEAFGSPNYDKQLMRAFLEDQKKLLLSQEPRQLDLGSASSS